MRPFYPIIYVRGYAMTRGEIDETTADPFCGFNLGSTVYRATSDRTKPPKKFIFESPVVRLASDFGYCDVFKDGMDIVDTDWDGTLPLRSIIVYHYYDSASKLLGSGETPPMEDFARGLSNLVHRVRELVCANDQHKDENGNPITIDHHNFRCYLVAHSMGGLVCRAFLQNAKLDVKKVRGCVEKIFTYATPHNGIEIAGINAPSWFSVMDMNNFNRERMAGYLAIGDYYKKTKCVDYVPDPEKYFCMIGTNRSDYEVALGLSRTFVGHGSDGLVRIENASVAGPPGHDGEPVKAASAYAYRAHSGYLGIVNSEEAYQNLVRFLFGDVRVDVWVDVETVTLPAELQQCAPEAVDALYQFEVMASPRGKRWFLSRRVSEEDSVACQTHKDLANGQKKIYLCSMFLANSARVNPERPSLAYSVMLGVKVPDYEVNRKIWFDKHYEGGYLFHDALIIELTPPQAKGETWKICHGWQSRTPLDAVSALKPLAIPGGRRIEVAIPFDGGKEPGITGNLRFVVSPWNR